MKRPILSWLAWAIAILSCSGTPTAHGAAPCRAARSQSATVHSACYWCETGIPVTQGHRYRITVHFPSPDDREAVRDSYLPINDLRGWPSPANIFGMPIFFLRREPRYPWFSLVATVDRRHPVRILPDMSYQAPASGELVCYFNDASWAYSNNHGSVKLTVADLNPGKRR